ncbi:MAG: hypothetical protein NC111_00175 [Bacteroides sp.]|nr:hypothetical protein [Bacteroides sp.]MCM1412773.1 hypothetical protein [Bacteroides sp.]MCM1470933.1 hypothetical protein [Bacteroides sp.]
MANKRELKKQIKYICGEVALECIITRECVENTDSEALNNLVIRLAELQEKSIKNATFSFDKTPKDFENKKAYHKAAYEYFHKAYASFYAEFNKQVQAIVDDLNKAIPAAQREANKQAANK